MYFFFFFCFVFVSACEYGSYKTYATPDNCTACPANSNTDSKGSTLINHCKCKTGYEGDPSKGYDCTGNDQI